MKAFIALCVVLAVGFVNGSVVPATSLVRTPQFDSAIIRSDRLGGNFAYSTVEGHAYAAVSPVVQRVSEPVGVTYTARQVNLGVAYAPVGVSQPIYAQQTISHLLPVAAAPAVVAAPGILGVPALGGIVGAPVLGGVASTPVAGAPAAPAAPAPTPVEGTPVDADTVAVDSA